ncbi:hypothetical protein GCM10007973_19300 [Polymorphobacter multimanifer]|nr:hypothetical protein GCM10007973_19300 [Polymorphobacter multimanifer]
MLCGREPKFVEALLTALGRPDLVEAACGEAGPGQDVVKAFLAETFAAQPRAFWEGWFAGRDVAFAPVRSLGEGLTHAGLIVADADGAHHIRPAISFAGEDWVPAPAPPLAGC